MTAPLYVVTHVQIKDTHEIDITLCCYTPSLDVAEGALEEYASQTLAMILGHQNEDALDDERPIEEVGAGHHLRFDEGALYPAIDVWKVKTKGDYEKVGQFNVLNVNKWKDDYLDEVTPAVAALAGDDTITGSVYAGNRPGGRVDRFLRGEGNYVSDEE